MGIINDGTYKFDERYKVKEDYEICLRHIRERGGIMGINYFFIQNKHWDRGTGCGAYRTKEIEEDAIKMLMKEYGKYVKRATKRKNGEYTISLRF